MQAYVPATMSDRMARLIQLGKIYILYNFQVKEYVDKDKFRPVKIDRQIVLTVDTKVKEVAESEIFIPQNTFDFYDFADLMSVAKQYQFLVGKIQKLKYKIKLPISYS